MTGRSDDEPPTAQSLTSSSGSERNLSNQRPMRPQIAPHRSSMRGRSGEPGCELKLFERPLAESHTTVKVPFDKGVIVIGSLNRAQFSGGPSEVAQTLDAIPGIQFWAGGRGIGQRWLPGTVGVASRSTIGKGRLSSGAQSGSRTRGKIGHYSSLFQRGQSKHFRCDCSSPRSIQPKLAKSSSAGSNCTVLTNSCG